MNKDEKWVREAIDLARRARENGNAPFGALLVVDGRVLHRAQNTVYTDSDVTRHAELNLVSEAYRQYGPDVLVRATLYTSTEPCAMCSGAIYWSGIARVVFACGVDTLREVAGHNLGVPCREIFARGVRDIEVTGPLLEAEGRAAYADYWKTPHA